MMCEYDFFNVNARYVALYEPQLIKKVHLIDT